MCIHAQEKSLCNKKKSSVRRNAEDEHRSPSRFCVAADCSKAHCHLWSLRSSEGHENGKFTQATVRPGILIRRFYLDMHHPNSNRTLLSLQERYRRESPLIKTQRPRPEIHPCRRFQGALATYSDQIACHSPMIAFRTSRDVAPSFAKLFLRRDATRRRIGKFP